MGCDLMGTLGPLFVVGCEDGLYAGGMRVEVID